MKWHKISDKLPKNSDHILLRQIYIPFQYNIAFLNKNKEKWVLYSNSHREVHLLDEDYWAQLPSLEAIKKNERWHKTNEISLKIQHMVLTATKKNNRLQFEVRYLNLLTSCAHLCPFKFDYWIILEENDIPWWKENKLTAPTLEDYYS